MISEWFEWDDAKEALNIIKHEVSFYDAARAFDDPKALHIWQQGETEDRFLLVGTTDGDILAVAYTERGKRTRIISARRATKHEIADYLAQN